VEFVSRRWSVGATSGATYRSVPDAARIAPRLGESVASEGIGAAQSYGRPWRS
jgi:hypothetical protein